MRLADWMIEIY